MTINNVPYLSRKILIYFISNPADINDIPPPIILDHKEPLILAAIPNDIAIVPININNPVDICPVVCIELLTGFFVA